MAAETKLNYRFKASQIECDDGTFEWGVRFIDVPEIIGAGDTVEEAYYEGLDNLKDYFEYLKEEGKPIPQPTFDPDDNRYSGRLVLRLSKNNHRKLAVLAEKENVSINALLNEIITEGITNRINNKAVEELIKDAEKEYAAQNNPSLKLAKN